MKHRKLLDKAVVAALLLAYVPSLTEDFQTISLQAAVPEPLALIAPVPEFTEVTEDHSADRL